MKFYSLRSVILAFSFLLLTPSSALADSADPVAVDGWELYSPDLIKIQGQTVMYSGGWDRNQENAFLTQGILPRDTIFRSVCTTPQNCSAAQPVIVPQNAGIGIINDPSVVNTGRGYLIMFMTGVESTTPGAGYTVTNNKVYLSTSWDYDGVNWSNPELVRSDVWLPSALVGPDGKIYMYANSNIDGLLRVYNLGLSGLEQNPGTAIAYYDQSGAELSAFYVNVHVHYTANSGLYSMFGQTGDEQRIDFLVSRDGIKFYLVRQNIVPVADPVTNPILTPAPWPDDACYIYYGKGGLTPDNGISIFLHKWC